MKFVKQFVVSVTTSDTTGTGTTEDYFTVAQILDKKGVSFKDFASPQEALAAAEHLQAQNMQEHGYSLEEFPTVVDEKFPQFTRMYFIDSRVPPQTKSLLVQRL